MMYRPGGCKKNKTRITSDPSQRSQWGELTDIQASIMHSSQASHPTSGMGRYASLQNCKSAESSYLGNDRSQCSPA